MQIYVAKGGEQTGPYSTEELQAMIDSMMVELIDPAWHEGLAKWKPLHEVLGMQLPDAVAAPPRAAPAPVASRPAAVQRLAPGRPAPNPRPSAIAPAPARAAMVNAPVAAQKISASVTGGYQPITVGNWVVTLLLQSIPLVGIVMLFVWAFSNDTQPSKRNYAKALLIFIGIVIGLGILVGLVGGVFAAMAARSSPH